MCCMGLSPQDGNIGFDSCRGDENPACSISNDNSVTPSLILPHNAYDILHIIQ